MQKNLLKIKYFESGLPNGIKKGNFIFSFEPSPFQRTKLSKNKRGLELVTSCSSGYKTSPYIIWPSLMMQYKVVFLLFQKSYLQIYASQFMTS